jgi:hypothetical protein
LFFVGRLEHQGALLLLGAVVLMDLALALLNLFLFLKRERKGKGFSPVPGIFVPLYLFALVAAKHSLLFGEEGFTGLRLIETTLTFCVLAIASICLTFVGPCTLAKALHRRQAGSP